MTLVQNKPIMLAAGAAAVAFLGWLAFGLFGIQAAFIDQEVSEEGPLFASGANAETATTLSAAEQDEVAQTEEFQEAMAEAKPTEVAETAEDAMPGEVVTVRTGAFTGSSRYTVAGSALVLNDGTEQRFLRLEDLDSSNGPDLNVYLRAENGDFVDLGDLRGNIGDQNYEIPPEVDLEVFNTVQIWCVRFGVLFGDAPLAAT